MVEIFINENPFVELSAQPTTDFNGSFPWIGKWPLDRTVRLATPTQDEVLPEKPRKKAPAFGKVGGWLAVPPKRSRAKDMGGFLKCWVSPITIGFSY